MIESSRDKNEGTYRSGKGVAICDPGSEFYELEEEREDDVRR